MKSIYLTIALGLLALPVSSQTADEFGRIALQITENNKNYRIDQQRIAAQAQQLKTDNNLSDPEVEFMHVWGQKGIGNKYEIGVSQGFEWPGVYGARKEASAAEVQALGSEARSNQFQLLQEVKAKMLDVVNSRNLIQLYGVALSEIDSLYAVVVRDVERKEVSILDANKLKIERIALSRKYNEAVQSLDAATNALCTLNGGTDCSELLAGLTEYPDYGPLRRIDSYLDDMMANSPTIQYRSSLSRANMARANTVKRQSYPSFNLGLRHVYELGERFNGFSVAMTLPFLSNRGKSKAVKLEAEALDMAADNESRQEASTLESDYSQTKLLLEELESYEKVFASDDNLRLLRKAFAARHITVLDYIGELTYFTNAKCDYLNLMYRYHQQRESLEKYSQAIP